MRIVIRIVKCANSICIFVLQKTDENWATAVFVAHVHVYARIDKTFTKLCVYNKTFRINFEVKHFVRKTRFVRGRGVIYDRSKSWPKNILFPDPGAVPVRNLKFKFISDIRRTSHGRYARIIYNLTKTNFPLEIRTLSVYSMQNI